MSSNKTAYFSSPASLVALACVAGLLAAGCPGGRAGGRSTKGSRLQPARLPAPWSFKSSQAIGTKEAYDDGLQAYRAGEAETGKERDELRAKLLMRAKSKLGAELSRRGGKEGFERFSEMISLVFVPDGDAASRPLLEPDQIGAGARKLLIEAAQLVLDKFGERGDVLQVLVARGVLHYLGHEPEAQKRRFRQIVDWLVRVEEAAAEEDDKDPVSMGVLDVLDEVAQHWPAPLVLAEQERQVRRLVDELRGMAGSERGLETTASGSAGKKGGGGGGHDGDGGDDTQNGGVRFLKAQALRRASRQLEGYLSQAYVLGGEWKEALEMARSWPFATDRDELLVHLLEQIVDGKPSPGSYQALADHFSGETPHVAEFVCRAAAGRFPSAAQPRFCLGELAEREEQALRSMISYEKAVRLDPKWHRAWENLARAYLTRLHDLVVRQQLGSVLAMLGRNEKLHSSALVRWPARPLEVSLARAFFAAGRAHANEGKMNKAAQYYRKALEVENLPEAHLELGHILYWRNRCSKAVKQYEASVEAAGGGGRQVYWLGKVAVRHSRCLARMGRKEEARRFLLRATSGLMRLVRLISDNDMRSQILVLQARILDELDKRDHAVRLLRAAVDLAPERTATYAEALSYTVSRGLVEEALDLYSRALVRDKVTEYQKAYATFWVLDLGRRCNLEPLRLHAAREYLQGLEGDEWYHRLAEWELGNVSTEQLREEASNLGERVELDFYEAMRRARKGDMEGAKKLWKKVVASGLYVYYEFRMAARYLREGLGCSRDEI